jgi:small subunit ribosomal protein S8
MTNDPIADMLIRIKNGYMTHKERVAVPKSKFKTALIRLLQQKKYVGQVHNADASVFEVELLYPEGKPAMTHVERMSKPGLRRYINVTDLAKIRQGLGFVILSTPQGLMTHIEAKKQRLGGEIICKIW